MFTYSTKGTCSRQILFDVDSENKLRNVRFIGGCSGNLQGIAKLVEGKTLDEIKQVWQAELEKAAKTSEYTEAFFMAGMRHEKISNHHGADARFNIQLVQLGDHTLVGLPFEVLTVIGTKIREAHPEASIISCTGGYDCYLPIAEDFPKGGYEADAGTVWAPDTGDNVIAESITALKEFKA